MKDKYIGLLFGFLFAGFILIYIKLANFTPPSRQDNEILKRITELNSKVDSLNNIKDSIRIVIDSTHIKIITNEKHYQEVVNNIITQPDSFSESFSEQYLRNYAATRGYNICGTSEIK